MAMFCYSPESQIFNKQRTRVNKLFIILMLFAVSISSRGQAETLSNTADSLLKTYQNSVFQVQLIETQSGKKSAIGSAFLIADNQVVTNFHVVSAWVHNPKLYHIEIIHQQHGIIKVSLQNFDVINDLAVLTADKNLSSRTFALADVLPDQGDKVFSIGNPHDYGMMVIPGTYNGITANSFYQRVNFTGSINPGMSGGPAINEAGHIIGVNVATAGNQMGFLVPLTHLQTLLKSTSVPLKHSALKGKIEQQLLASQNRFFGEILATQWQTSQLGRHQIVTELTPYVRCWGYSNSDKKDALFEASEVNCRSQEQIFINPKLRTGNIEIEYSYIKQDSLNSFQFSQLLKASFSGVAPGNAAGKTDVSNYHCQQDIITPPPEGYQKSLYCVRSYKKYPQLFDVLYLAVSHSSNNQDALLSHYTLAGVSQPNAKRFLRRFIEVVK